MRNCVKGPGKYGRNLSDMFGGMSVENKPVFGCPEVQQRCDSAKGECGANVCQVKRTLTKDTVCIAGKAAKKLRRPHPKIEDDLT